MRDARLRDQAGCVQPPPAQNQRFVIAGGGDADQNLPPTNKVDIIGLKASAATYQLRSQRRRDAAGLRQCDATTRLPSPRMTCSATVIGVARNTPGVDPAHLEWNADGLGCAAGDS